MTTAGVRAVLPVDQPPPTRSGRRLTRRGRGDPISEPFFSFLYRVTVGIAAFLLASVPLAGIGWLSHWQLSGWMILVQALIMCPTVVVAEHLRLVIYGRYVRQRATVVFEVAWPRPTRDDALIIARVRHQTLTKRAMDLAVTSWGLVVLSPALVAISVMIRFESAGPVLVDRERIGRRGRPFRLYHFRTTVVGGDGLPHLTRVGRFLKRTSLEALPELISILRGEMSLVGPRPLGPEEVNRYPGLLTVLPGLTGLWAVSGATLSYADSRALEEKYIRSRSLFLDLKILAKTVVAVARIGSY